MTAGRSVTIVVHTDGELESRKYRVPLWALKGGKWGALIVALLAVLFFAFAGPITRAAIRVPGLEHDVTRLRAESTRVHQLATALGRAESNYQAVRQLLGGKAPAGEALAPPPNPAPSLTIATKQPGPQVPQDTSTRPTRRRVTAAPVPGPAASAPASSTKVTLAAPAPTPAKDTVTAAAGSTATKTGSTAMKQYETGPSVPAHWPLDVTGFVTRGQTEAADSESHEGIDIAVPVGSQIRAAGGGTVAQADSNADYGWFVLLRHPNGYESLYGHASRLLVHAGTDVQAGQVIALTGNSGRSTAPHLHFEIRQDGRPVDPLTLVKEGR